MKPVLAALLAVCALGLGTAAAHAATVDVDGDDQVVITGGLNVPEGETVGDVVVVDGPVRIAGRATGDVIAIAGSVRISGSVDGDVAAVSQRITLAPTARVGGDLLYGDERPVVPEGAQVAGEIRDQNWSETLSGWGWVSWFGWWLAVSVSTLLAGILLVWLAPRGLEAASRAVRERTGAVVGFGVLTGIGIPIVAVIALVTLVGIPFGIGLLLALLPLLSVAYVTCGWVLGRRIVRTGSPWLALLAGWGILRVLALIPVLGGIVGFVATVVGLGAIVVAIWRSRRPSAPQAAPDSPGWAAPG